MVLLSAEQFWVGQANDTTSGIHPSGWSSGQRYALTSSQWHAMYDTEYANAHDTAGTMNTHPTPGWVSGQLWSLSTSQWQQQWLSDFNARYASGYTAGYNVGHAQGQTDYQPAPLWQTWITGTGTDASFAGVGWFQSATITLPYNGQYIAFASGQGGEFSPGWQLETEMHVGTGVYGATYGYNAKPVHPQGGESYVRVSMPATYQTAGTQAFFRVRYSDNNGANQMYIAFVPTPANPH